ncbi:MAG: hypothetical protein L0177_09255 [Chloroflexi bacterium]|nr:hypothetical protein [Chloroflexota bacterium]
MPKKRAEENTRQLFAAIREDLYLAAKARAAELRMPMREFIAYALELALAEGAREPGQAFSQPSRVFAPRTIWDEEESLRRQAADPLGADVELSHEEAEKVARAMFGAGHVLGTSTGSV